MPSLSRRALIDNQGTSSGSRVVQLYNGRAEISVRLAHGRAELGVHADGLQDALCAIEAS
jgi:beta-galactosidase